MLFPTIDFAIFFAVAFTANWLLNPYPRLWKLAMIAASYVFYSWWDWRFVFLLAAVTVTAHVGAIAVAHFEAERSRRLAMAGGVGALLGILGWFKYYGFLAVNVDNLFHTLGSGRLVPLLQVTLPVGVSFFTFMAISYVVDVYRRQLDPARSVDLAVYLSFFPHLIAGPIVRGEELLPQIRRKRDPAAIDFGRAAWLVAGGLFKKVVISSYIDSAIVDAGVLRAAPALGARDPLRHLRVRRADLRRFQRVHRHRHRAGHVPGVPVPRQLRRTVHGAQPPGLLAAVAHDPVALVARLPLHPPGGSHGSQWTSPATS